MSVLRIFLLVFLLVLQLWANDKELAIKIYNTIALECTKKTDPQIYLHGDLGVLYETKKIHRTYDCSDADFVIVVSAKADVKEEWKKIVILSQLGQYRFFFLFL